MKASIAMVTESETILMHIPTILVNVAGELDKKFNLTLVLAITSLIIIILSVALYVIRRNPADDIENNANQLNYQPQQHQFTDDNGHHWLRQADGALYWWNGQNWQKMQ